MYVGACMSLIGRYMHVLNMQVYAVMYTGGPCVQVVLIASLVASYFADYLEVHFSLTFIPSRHFLHLRGGHFLLEGNV